MTLESSITELNASVQTLIKVISGLDASIAKPKATKPAPAKKVEPTTLVASVVADTPTLDDIISEMKAISDRTILAGLLSNFGSKTASGIPEDRRSAFIEAVHQELQGAA
jgi:hypothetical protein